jgi:hypothetical protein
VLAAAAAAVGAAVLWVAGEVGIQIWAPGAAAARGPGWRPLCTLWCGCVRAHMCVLRVRHKLPCVCVCVCVCVRARCMRCPSPNWPTRACHAMRCPTHQHVCATWSRGCCCALCNHYRRVLHSSIAAHCSCVTSTRPHSAWSLPDPSCCLPGCCWHTTNRSSRCCPAPCATACLKGGWL